LGRNNPKQKTTNPKKEKKTKVKLRSEVSPCGFLVLKTEFLNSKLVYLGTMATNSSWSAGKASRDGVDTRNKDLTGAGAVKVIPEVGMPAVELGKNKKKRSNRDRWGFRCRAMRVQACADWEWMYGTPETEYQYFCQKMPTLKKLLSGSGAKHIDALDSLFAEFAEDNEDLQEICHENEGNQDEPDELSYWEKRNRYYREYPFGLFEW